MQENILSVSIGVLARPVTTLRWICEQRPVVWAIIINLFTGLISAALQVSQSDTYGALLGAQIISLPPGVWFIIASLLGLLGLVIGAAFYHFVAFLLGGRSTYGGMFSAMAFSSLPGIFAAPLALLSVLLGLAGSFLSGLGGFGLGIWTIALLVISIRENYQFSTGRAIVAFLIPFLVALGLALLVAIIAVLLIAASFATR